MRDRLRAFRERRLRDRDRRWLFACVASVLVMVATVLVVLDDAGPEAEDARRTPRAAALNVVPEDAPSEEGRPDTASSASDIAASKQTARRFLAAYLPLTYGRGSARELPATTPELRDLLAREVPRVPPGLRGWRPRVELLQSNGVNHEHADLMALVDDSRRRYSVELELDNTPDGWLVTGLGG